MRTVPVDSLDVGAYRPSTDAPESDGTLAWTSTTIVVVEASAAGKRGVGYTYADRATAKERRWSSIMWATAREMRGDGAPDAGSAPVTMAT
jgi:hypothetical protein